MASLLEQQVTEYLTFLLGRAPTAEEIRLGTIAPFPLASIHNTANIAQNTISITDTDDIQEAVDKINANGGGVVYLNPGTYFPTSSITMPDNVYLIGLVKNICIIDFGNHARSILTSGANVTLQEFTVQKSSTSGIKLSNCTGLVIVNNVDIDDCTVGFEATNCILGINIIGGGLIASNCDSGLKFDTVTGFIVDDSTFQLCTLGMELIDTSFGVIRACGFQANSSDAVNGDNIDTIGFENLILIQNGGDAFNISNGSVANRIFGCRISDNTGVGVNIAAASCINNIIAINNFANNGGGSVTDSGTTTLIRSNIGVADN